MNTNLHPARTFFGRRKGHKLRNRQAELLTSLLPRLALDIARPVPRELAELFPSPVSEVQLEIGFGGGENLVAQAAARPAHGFIGVEPFVNGMAKALAAIEDTDLENIRLHFDEADGLMKWLPDGSLARIELVHPDPWPKRRHWKRRFVTDISDYAAWTLQRFLRSPDFEWTAQCADDWRRPWPEFSGTRYHAKAARQERAPCFLIFRRR